MFLFEKSDVYQKSLQFAEGISILIEGFSRGNGYLTDQLQRAALSIAANIAEGNGRYHRKERCNSFWIARGSAFECVPMLDYVFAKSLLKKRNTNITATLSRFMPEQGFHIFKRYVMSPEIF